MNESVTGPHCRVECATHFPSRLGNLKNLFFDFEHMPGNYSVQRPVGIVHGPRASLQRRKRRILITFLGKGGKWSGAGEGAAKRGLNDAKVVAFWCVKSLSTKKVAKLEASCCLPPTSTLPPTLSLSPCVSLIYAASLGCASTGRNSCNSLSLLMSAFIWINWNLWFRSEQKEKRKLRTFSVNWFLHRHLQRVLRKNAPPPPSAPPRRLII